MGDLIFCYIYFSSSELHDTYHAHSVDMLECKMSLVQNILPWTLCTSSYKMSCTCEKCPPLYCRSSPSLSRRWCAMNAWYISFPFPNMSAMQQHDVSLLVFFDITGGHLWLNRTFLGGIVNQMCLSACASMLTENTGWFKVRPRFNIIMQFTWLLKLNICSLASFKNF